MGYIGIQGVAILASFISTGFYCTYEHYSGGDSPATTTPSNNIRTFMLRPLYVLQNTLPLISPLLSRIDRKRVFTCKGIF
tara:strand:+ start:2825 stop:3064 length:240 start_codon:yes stop_codon:yes gene_type:complete